MDMKKILALAIVVLAVFSCMSVVSAGWFDFLGGGTNNATFTFDGFTLDLPENANITNETTVEDNYEQILYEINWTDDGSKDTTYISVCSANGSDLVDSVDEYVSNWVSEGAKSEGTTVVGLSLTLMAFQYPNWPITVLTLPFQDTF